MYKIIDKITKTFLDYHSLLFKRPFPTKLLCILVPAPLGQPVCINFLQSGAKISLVFG